MSTVAARRIYYSPDAPACAVPVQAASRLGAVQGFSVSFFVTSFFENGYKKDRQLFADCDQSTVSFSVFSFCMIAYSTISSDTVIVTAIPALHSIFLKSSVMSKTSI